MTDARDEKGELLPDTVRLTGFGKLLRSTSLDELPELWNIVKGDMSLIGPRPLLVSYLPYYTEEEQKRHSVRAGLTGLAQINGRSALNWEERFAYDLEYVKHCSLGMDFKIFFMTIGKVFTRSGTLEGEAQPLPDFDDYRREQRKEAAEYIDQYFSTYPGVKKFLDKLVEDGKRDGFVTTMFGRRRPVPAAGGWCCSGL